MGEGAFEMVFCGQSRSVTNRIALGERVSNGAPAPGTAEIEAVQMNDASITSVADARRLEQCLGLALLQMRKEAAKPRDEFLRRQNPAHAFGFDQRRRKKVLSRWLPCLAVPIPAVPGARGFPDQ